jgi:hypothetical protein
VRRINSCVLGISLSLLGTTSIVADESGRGVTGLERDSPVVRGSVIILKEAMTKSVSVNVGGLLVVQISDSQSHPPQNIAVKASSGDATFLGHVRGVRSADDGKTLFGGGYTWYLFRAAELTKNLHIDVSYVPNGIPNPTRLKRTHQIEIESD